MVTVNASGDGIDSNGDIEVTGGELYISGPTSNGDGTIDCDGSATITGGIVVAAGSTGMAENFGTASTQGSILVNLCELTGQTITLKDSDGNILPSFTPAKAFGCVVVALTAWHRAVPIPSPSGRRQHHRHHGKPHLRQRYGRLRRYGRPRKYGRRPAAPAGR